MNINEKDLATWIDRTYSGKKVILPFAIVTVCVLGMIGLDLFDVQYEDRIFDWLSGGLAGSLAGGVYMAARNQSVKEVIEMVNADNAQPGAPPDAFGAG